MAVSVAGLYCIAVSSRKAPLLSTAFIPSSFAPLSPVVGPQETIAAHNTIANKTFFIFSFEIMSFNYVARGFSLTNILSIEPLENLTFARPFKWMFSKGIK
jgi:hypothetical protein